MTNPVDISDLVIPQKASSPLRETMEVFVRSWVGMTGLILLTCIVAFSVFGPMIIEADPFEIIARRSVPPGAGGPILGTDALGRDLFIRLLYGGSTTLTVGAVAALISIFIGVTIGALAGYFGGLVDELLMRFTEFFQVLPALLFAMVIAALFAPSLTSITISIGVVIWPPTARLARAEFMKIRKLDYVDAERVIGAGSNRIIWKVILPNAMPPLVVSATLSIGLAVLFEAALSFLGLGDANRTSWGLMIGDSRSSMLSNWWAVAFPGIMIVLTVLSISLIGDGLNDALNPKLRERR